MADRVSDRDRERMRRQGEALREAETDDPGTPEQRQDIREIANRLRVESGREPFPDPDQDPPELGFHRRARSLGMARIDR